MYTKFKHIFLRWALSVRSKRQLEEFVIRRIVVLNGMYNIMLANCSKIKTERIREI